MIRIPGWVRNEVLPSDLYSYADNKKTNYSVKINGESIQSSLAKGYLSIDRKWKKGDRIEIHFDMQPRMVKAHEKVKADKGRVSFERGPVVYCAEWPDNYAEIPSILLPEKPEVEVVDKPDMLNGIKELKTQAQSLSINEKGWLETRNVTLTLIPYYAWSHRGDGQMAVSLPQEVGEVVATKMK